MSEVEQIGEKDEVTSRNKRAKKAQLEQDAAISALMQHPQTRSWMYQLLSWCGMYQSSFDRSALSMAFNEGARNVGLRVTSEIMRVCPDSYVQMIREAEAQKDNG